jgi:catechol 2,3-dioxygenase-like lactoylglutathione lyase family enzyme
MAITRFDHVAINSRDIAGSKAFYCGILGLAIDKSVDMGELVLHYIRLPDNSAIELFEHKDRKIYDELQAKEGCETEPRLVKHIAFNVDNIEELNQKLIQNNVKFEMDLCVLEKLKVKALLCFDPDGVIVELAQKI